MPSPGLNYGEPRLDGDIRKPRVPKCGSEQEIMELLSGVRWERIRMGISEAAMRGKESLVPVLAYLAKHGWNDMLKNQSELRDDQFRNIVGVLAAEKMEQTGEVGKSRVMLMIPAHAMNTIRASADPRVAAQEFREKINMIENCERQVITKRAMEALGEMGCPAATAELVKLVFCSSNNGMWAASVLERAARERPAEVIPVLKEGIKVYTGKPEADDGVDALAGICARAGKS